MLFEPSWKDGDICSIKLVTGDELVSKVHSHDASSLTLHRPFVLTVGVDQNTQQPQLQMLPTLLVSGKRDAKLKISMQHIITIALSEEAARDAYHSNLQNMLSPAT